MSQSQGICYLDKIFLPSEYALHQKKNYLNMYFLISLYHRHRLCNRCDPPRIEFSARARAFGVNNINETYRIRCQNVS